MTALPITYLADDIATAPQLLPEQMQDVARAGFRSVIGNRPDHEGGAQQPTSQALRAAAEAAGLTYVHQPVPPANFTPADVERFAGLLDTLPRPLLAFCRTGTRSAKLYRAASSESR